MNTNYQRLREIRNKTLHPNGISLEKGCIYIFKERYTTPNGYVTFEVGEQITLAQSDSKYEWYFTHTQIRGMLDFKTAYVKNHLENKGKPVSINDVLIMLMDKGYSFREYHKHKIQIEKNGVLQLVIDLTKDLIRQEEVCKQLLTILK